MQVDAELKRLGQFTPIRTCPVYGGQKIMAQMKFLKHGPEILVGTPGRVIDLLDRRIINFHNVRFVVLDEVDRMLDIGFRDDIRNILSRVKGMSRRVPQSAREGDAPAEGRRRQDENAEARTTQTRSPDDLRLRDDQRRDRKARRAGTCASRSRSSSRPAPTTSRRSSSVEQYYFSVQPWDKYRLLGTLLLSRKTRTWRSSSRRTKRGAEKLAKRLHADGIECREIHGNLAQNKRERVMKSFRTGSSTC